MPMMSFARLGRTLTTWSAGSAAPSASTPSHSVPPVSSHRSATALRAAKSIVRASTPRWNRYPASVLIARRRAIVRTVTGSQVAISKTMSVVPSSTSDAAPPMTPARLVAFSASATTRSASTSVRSLLSRVRSFS